MTQSRKKGSKIHANNTVSGIKRFFADRIPDVNPGLGYAAFA